MRVGHVVGPRTYYPVFAALIVLTVTTVGIDWLERDGTIDMPRLAHTVISLLIATVKAVLVVLFFMHVWYSSRVIWLVAGGSVLWLGILMTYTLTDYLTRSSPISGP